LSELQKSFTENGFCLINESVVDTELLDTAKNRIEHIVNGNYNRGLEPWGKSKTDYQKELFRIIQVHLTDHAFYDLITKSKIGKIVAGITKSKSIKIWGTQLYIKPPKSHSTNHIGWHRDSQHASFFKEGVVSVWLPLDRVDSNTSPLKYLNESHKLDLFEQPIMDINEDLNKEANRIASISKNKNWEITEAILPKGGFSIHHWDVIHASENNFSNKHRYALAIGLATDRVELNKDVNDYGYFSILDNPDLCPIIYKE